MSSKLVSRSIFLVLVALAAACETAYKDGVPNERSSWFQVPPGSKLVLHRRLDVPPFQHAAYLQQGRLLPWYDVNLHAPYCALGLQGNREAARSVDPGEFVVRRVSLQSLFMLAAGPLMRVARDRNDDGMTYEVVATVMELSSGEQAEVRSLTCASWGLPQGRSYLTVEQIRGALGSYVTLNLAVP
jgi:hypothetical protein